MKILILRAVFNLLLNSVLSEINNNKNILFQLTVRIVVTRDVIYKRQTQNPSSSTHVYGLLETGRGGTSQVCG